MKPVCCCVSLLVSQQGRVAAGDGREALTGQAAPAWSGLSGELGRPRPVPSPCWPCSPAECEGTAGGAGPCHPSPAEGSAAPPGRAHRFCSSAPGGAEGLPGPCPLPFPSPTCRWQRPVCGRVTARGASAGTDLPPVVTCGNKEPSVVQLLQGEKSEVPETVGSRLWFSYATES